MTIPFPVENSRALRNGCGVNFKSEEQANRCSIGTAATKCLKALSASCRESRPYKSSLKNIGEGGILFTLRRSRYVIVGRQRNCFHQ